MQPSRAAGGLSHIAGDVTRLSPARLGTFDFFPGIGCFAGWEMLTVEPASTAGLGWPMNKTTPHWYRLRRRTYIGSRTLT